MNREQAIEAIKNGTHVLDVVEHSEEAESFVKDELVDAIYYQDERYYGIDAEGVLIFLNDDEINGRPIIKLSDILSEVWTEVPTNFRPPTDDEINSLSDSPKETSISETKDMMEYDKELIEDWDYFWIKIGCYMGIKQEAINKFMAQRYPNEELEELLKQREELDKRIKELKGKA